MEIKNPQEHYTCFYYGCAERPAIEVCNRESQQSEMQTLKKNEIRFILEGTMCFTYGDYQPTTVKKGAFFFLASGSRLHCKTLTNCLFMVVRLQKNVFLCEGCRVEELFKEKKTDTPVRSLTPEINILQINEPLWHFLKGLKVCILGGLLCTNYFETKIREMFILLRAYYSRAELRDFLFLILSPDSEFSEKIRKNHHKYKTALDMAKAMNMTQKNFTKKFKAVFGEPPAQWMKKEKAREIYTELYTGKKTLLDIACEYGFSNLPSFNRFCKRELGKNPGELRNAPKG